MPDYGGFMGPAYGVGRMSRIKKTAQKRLARLLRGRTEPHGIEITDESVSYTHLTLPTILLV